MSQPLITTIFCATLEEGSLDDFAQLVKIEPSYMQKKGDARPCPRPKVPTTEWVLERKKIASYSIDDELVVLLESIWPLKKELAQWSAQYQVSYLFQTVVYIEDERPEYYLGPIVMEKMAKLGARWEIAIQ